MKMQSENLFTAVSKTTTENLAAQVQETLAKGYNNNQLKTFSNVDLWHIHRQRKSIVIR